MTDPVGAVPVEPQKEKPGTWPQVCVQRAFVEGMQWWQFHHNGSTAFPSERNEAEAEALRRYGEPVAEAERDTLRADLERERRALTSLADHHAATERIVEAAEAALARVRAVIAEMEKAEHPKGWTRVQVFVKHWASRLTDAQQEPHA